jgi:hypothetical protein
MTPQVLYTEGLEPLTIVDVPEWLMERLRVGHHIQLAVPFEVSLANYLNTEPINQTFNLVKIWGEPITRRSVRSMMLFTRCEDNALLLESSLLPGQRKDSQRRAKEDFVKGVAYAFSQMARKR